MFRSRTQVAILTLAVIPVLWISGTLGQEGASVVFSENAPNGGEVSEIGDVPGGDASVSDVSGDAVAVEAAPDPTPRPYGGGFSSSTPAANDRSRSSSSTSTSSGYSAASASSDGAAGDFFTYMHQTRTSEPDPMREADKRFAQSTRDLIAKYQEVTEPDERQSILDQLGDVLTRQFEVRQQIRARELEELEAQVQRLRELHDRREEEKDQIVRDHLQQLLRDAEGLGWGSSDALPSSGVRFQWSGPDNRLPGAGPARPARPR